jgi:RNase P subunit RPR2
MTCPACASTRLTAIQIRLAPDEDHTFASCQACEWKGWFKGGHRRPPGQGPGPGQRTPVLTR